VYSVRSAQHRIAQLQTDHLQVMKQIELELHALHSEFTPPPSSLVASMVVDSVESESAAAIGGLVAGARIVDIGGVRNLYDVRSVLHEGVCVSVLLEDGTRVSLVPGTGGRLGCHISSCT
jgi:hypothetical protein